MSTVALHPPHFQFKRTMENIVGIVLREPEPGVDNASAAHSAYHLLLVVCEYCDVFDRFVVDFSNWNNRTGVLF